METSYNVQERSRWFVPINLGTIIDWKQKKKRAVDEVRVPINLGTIIDWKQSGTFFLTTRRKVPINLGTIIDWKHSSVVRCASDVVRSY